MIMSWMPLLMIPTIIQTCRLTIICIRPMVHCMMGMRYVRLMRSLFYRLCAEVGISARVIAGNPDASTGKPTHGWNIVRLGDVYYNVDATWDDEFPGYYLFFLKSKNGFFEHTRDKQYETAAFEAAFPMAANNYVLPDQKEINTQGVPVLGGVKAVQTKNDRVSLSWSQVTGADSFYIYRAESGKGYYCIGITTNTAYQNEITPGNTYRYLDLCTPKRTDDRRIRGNLSENKNNAAQEGNCLSDKRRISL